MWFRPLFLQTDQRLYTITDFGDSNLVQDVNIYKKGGRTSTQYNSLQELEKYNFNPLSQEGGGGCCTPLSDFPSCRFCVFAKVAIRSIYPPFVQITMYLFNNCCHKKSCGMGGGCNNPPPSRKERGGSKNK